MPTIQPQEPQHGQDEQRRHEESGAGMTDMVPWKYCNVYANNRSPERLFVFQGHSIFIQQRLDETIALDQNTGNVVWDGAYLMAKYLESHVKDLQGKTCLELGAGTGLVSIVAWLLGARQVLATDLAGTHTEHVKRNSSMNTTRIASERQIAIAADATAGRGTRGTRRRDRLRTIVLKSDDLQVAPLDWSSPSLPDEVAFQGPFSFILCSEILYLPQLHRALLKTITQFSDENTKVILLWKQRGLGEERFFELASRPSAGWHIEHLDRGCLDGEFQDQPYGIALMALKQRSV